MNEGDNVPPFSILVKIRFMKIVTFCIYITICFLIIGCKKSTSTIRDNAYDSVEKYETELEKLCLESHNGSVTYSIRIKTEDLTNDYEYKYLGSLKIKKNNFANDFMNSCFVHKKSKIPHFETVMILNQYLL